MDRLDGDEVFADLVACETDFAESTAAQDPPDPVIVEDTERNGVLADQFIDNLCAHVV